MTEGESLRRSFGELEFRFENSTVPDGECRLVGFAPEGRVGVIEVLETDDESRFSLLLSATLDRNMEFWSAACVAALAVTLRVDFPGWLGDQIRRRGRRHPWSTTRLFGDVVVSATFYPIDSVLVTIQRSAWRARSFDWHA